MKQLVDVLIQVVVRESVGARSGKKEARDSDRSTRASSRKHDDLTIERRVPH